MARPVAQNWERSPEVEQKAYQMGITRDKILRTREEDLEHIVLGVQSIRDKKRRDRTQRLERAPRAYARTELLDPREHQDFRALERPAAPETKVVKRPSRAPKRMLSLPKISVSHLVTQTNGLRQLHEIVHDVIGKADQLEAGVHAHAQLQEQYQNALAPEEVAWMNEQSDVDLEHIAQVREFLADVMDQLGQLISERTMMLNKMEHGHDATSTQGRELLTRLKNKTTKMELLLTAIRARFDCLPMGSAREGVN